MTVIEIINASSVLVTAIATLGLAIFTVMYLIETNKSEKNQRSIEMRLLKNQKSPGLMQKNRFCHFKAMMIRIQDGMGCISATMVQWPGMLQSNTHPVFKRGQPPLFLYTLGQGERISISGDWTSVRDANGTITVNVSYHDAELRRYEKMMRIDYNEIP